MKKNMMIAVDFDRKSVRYRKNGLGRRGFQQNENFCDRLNGAVEEILDAISEKKMSVYRSRKQEMQRRQERLNDALLAALVPGWKY